MSKANWSWPDWNTSWKHCTEGYTLRGLRADVSRLWLLVRRQTHVYRGQVWRARARLSVTRVTRSERDTWHWAPGCLQDRSLSDSRPICQPVPWDQKSRIIFKATASNIDKSEINQGCSYSITHGSWGQSGQSEQNIWVKRESALCKVSSWCTQVVSIFGSIHFELCWLNFHWTLDSRLDKRIELWSFTKA